MNNELFQERVQIREDLMAHKQPKRVPVYVNFALEAACGLGGVDLLKTHYDFSLYEKAFDKVCDTFYSDSIPCGNLRFPPSYQLLGAKNWILGSGGAVQHPEIETMLVEDYDEFIAKPYETLVTKFLPRVCTALDQDPINAALSLSRAYSSYKDDGAQQGGIMMKLFDKYSYAGGLMGGGQLLEAPFDFLSDQLRGFKAITMDIRRIPDKVAAACEAILPLIMKLGTPAVMRPGIVNGVPLHMPPYISGKAFEKLYWPTFKKMIDDFDKMGIASSIFAEEDWTRYSEYLAQLPESCIVMFENGDYTHLKEVVGKNHIITGFYDPTISLTRSKEECIDEAKRICDTCMPGGRFAFGFDKGVMDIKSIDVPKIQAVLEWVRDNAVY